MRVHYSQAYRKMDVTRERISRILELREILLSIQAGFSLVITVVPQRNTQARGTSRMHCYTLHSSQCDTIHGVRCEVRTVRRHFTLTTGITEFQKKKKRKKKKKKTPLDANVMKNTL